MKKAKQAAEQAVLITTEHRGVFFGYASDATGSTVVLKRARNCLYWSRDVKGFLGLATTGPTAQCKIGPAAKEITLHKVTSATLCEPASVEAWEKAPWVA